MVYTEKNTVEDFIIQELQKLGWKYVEPKGMSQKRKKDFREPLVIKNLRNTLKKINVQTKLTNTNLESFIASLRTIPATLEGIRNFLDIFINGSVVPIQKERKDRILKLVDLENIENNTFIVTNQFRVEGFRRTIKADIILLVNGIPLVLIECKNPTSEKADWTDAYKQIKRYEEQAPDLFKYVRFSIATDGIQTYYFPNMFNEEGEDSLSIWEDPYPFKGDEFKDDTLKITVYGFLSKPNLLKTIKNLK